MFTIGETQPNCDANEPQEDAQGTRQIHQGRLNNETPEQSERRPQSKDNIAWLSKDSTIRRKQRSRGTADWNITGSTTKVAKAKRRGTIITTG